MITTDTPGGVYNEFLISSSGPIPQDNGYLLMAGLSRKFPFLHGNKSIQIAPVRGSRTEHGKIHLDKKSILHIRGITTEQADEIANGWIMVAGYFLVIGEAQGRPLAASPYLASRLVILPGATSRASFLAALHKRLPSVVSPQVGKQRRFHIKGRAMLGFPVHLAGLSDEASLEIQARGVGKYTSMGCGVFYPGSVGRLRGLPQG